MGKNPAFQFYPGDWVQDTRALSLAAKGAWIDLLCAMWRSQTRGSLTLSMVGYSRIISATVDQTEAVITELTDLGICDSVTLCNKNVTLSNRRMQREENERISTRLRVKKFRKRESNADVTVLSSSSSSVLPKKLIQNSKSLQKKETLLDTAFAESDVKIAYGRSSHEKVLFDQTTGTFSGLNGREELWAKAYPAVNVEQEILRAAAWLASNPKNKKSDYLRFLNNWISRAQDRAPRVESQDPFEVLRRRREQNGEQ